MSYHRIPVMLDAGADAGAYLAQNAQRSASEEEAPRKEVCTVSTRAKRV